MNDRNEKLIITALEEYTPLPGQEFYQRMADSPWYRSKQQRRITPIRRFAIGAVAVLLAAIALGFSIPSVRASFIKFLGLGFSPSETVSNPAIAMESLVSSEKVNEISQAAGWSIKVPTWLPEGYRFNSAMYDSSNQMVLLTFFVTRQLPGNDPNLTVTEAITLVQAMRNDVVPLMVAPSTLVSDITVNGQAAAYATGAWESDAVTGQSTWNNAYPLQNIFWQIDNIYLNLNTKDAPVSKEDLLRVADSVR